MSSTGTTTSRSSSFARPASMSSMGRAAGDEAADLLERPLGRGEADPLHRRSREPVESLQAECQVGAALFPGDRVHLVHDHRLDSAQHFACLRGEQEEERLRRRDQDVRRLAEHRLALAGRRVACTHADLELRSEPRQRAAQVPLDVVVQRLQRRDVEQPQSFARCRGQAVDPVQERGQRLSRAGRGLDEHVTAPGDGRPAERLCRRGRLEGALEPGAHRLAEHHQRLHITTRLARERMFV